MKKMILSLTGAVLGCTAFAASCVTVKQISTDYTAQTVMFTLTWTGCNATNNHLNKVWCFVDVRAGAADGSKGAWTRATISGTPSVANGTYTAGNTSGFYVTGTNGQSATVTVKLGNAAAMFDWCAFATDYPPNVSVRSGTVNTFKGTAYFVVNGVAQSNNTYNGTVNSLTDATGCPGCIGRDVSVHANVPCCANLTAMGGYCRNLAADAAFKASCSGELEVKSGLVAYQGPYNTQLGCPAGWRPATMSELECLYVHYRSQAGMPDECWITFINSTAYTGWDGVGGRHCVSCTSNTSHYHLMGYNPGTTECWWGATYGQVVPQCDFVYPATSMIAVSCVR